MKSRLTELREPSCCCIGVRKTTFAFALIQACLLCFSLSIYVIGILRASNIVPTSYYVADDEGNMIAALELDSNPNSASFKRVVIEAQSQPVVAPSMEVAVENNGQMVVVLTEKVEEIGSIEHLQLRALNDEYEAEPSITTCRGRRDALLVLGTVGTAFFLTLLVLIGVWRSKPTYLLPYCCMLLCDLVLTTGVLLTASFYISNAREWIALQRYVDIAFKERLLRLSDTELHAALGAIGISMLLIKSLWFLIVCRCYVFLVELNNRRLLNKFGLAEKTAPFALGHHRAGSAGFVPLASRPSEITKHSRNLSDVSLPISITLPPSYEEKKYSPPEFDRLLQTKQK